ncbi:microfibrillar-associated protein 1-like [Oryza brachyantha]|uniref:Micro-fibrillar-associated protein 1 C-terminal domain-containing protein n=1 Tax=Oryza brachyantha TaxID=4533 RepID=J3LBS0_ORYBR|nr:microfibrillar-associated protein 1-like [Oryza brachyantha]
MSVAAGVSDAAIAVRDKLRGKIGQTKVKRYWPGKAPEWADAGEDDADLQTTKVSLDKAFPKDEDGGAPAKADDRRLRRLAQTREENKEELRADHRRIRQAEIVSTVDEENERQEAELEEEDEEAQEERRRRIRERQLLREQEELLPQEEEEPIEEEEEEEESEYETDSEDEQMGMAMVKPVFIPKSQRDTIAERERLEEEERQLEELVKKRLEARKIETRQIVVEEIRKEEHIEKTLNEEANIEDVDTDDELNEAEEYESWKNREIARIKRDREERDARLKEKEEIEKVRNMTEEERREWERKNPKPLRQSKQKWKFMQKYYHKGAFFQEGADDVSQSAGKDDIYGRDFSAPTGEDKMDKSILPKVMQVKHFGRSGRTKWTHLVNEDTTDWNAPWSTNGPLRAKYNAKMAGMNAPIAKPKGSKKMKDWDTKQDD